MAVPRVIIVGGGVGGVSAAQQLAKANFADVTVIDRRDYFEIPWSNVRIPVDPDLINNTTLPLQDVPKVGRVVHASATSVSETEVQLDNGSSLPFDYLVLASGSTWDDPVNSGTDPLLTDRKLNQQRHSAELKAAGTVLVIGGGAVGVELAAEVAEAYPEKQVTVVQANKELVPGYSARLSRQILSVLKSLNVEVLLSEKAHKLDEQRYKLSPSGRTITADKVYVCIGGKPNTNFLKAESSRTILDERGFVKVNNFLQVEGRSNWFALGDITSLSDYRLGRLAVDQGALVASHIKTLHGGTTKLKAWKKHNGIEMIAVSLGRNNGAMALWGWGFSGWLPTWLKSRDLLVGMTRKNMGLPAVA
ncbi:hypothetical protein WJX79_004881 [Trebouxia sp. C0005]